MWKIMHKLFGNDYVYWDNGTSNRVCKIYTTPFGEPYIHPYAFLSVIYFIKNIDPNNITFLTCDKNKYIKD